MSDQPFKDEDVLWRWKPTRVQRNGVYAAHYCIVKENNACRLWYKWERGRWYSDEMSVWSSELVRQLATERQRYVR